MGRLCASHQQPYECVPKSYNIMDAVCSIYLIFFAIALSAACFSWCMAGYGHFTNYSHKSIYCPSTSIFPKHKQSFQTRNTFAWLVLRSGVIKAHRIQIKQSKWKRASGRKGYPVQCDMRIWKEVGCDIKWTKNLERCEINPFFGDFLKIFLYWPQNTFLLLLCQTHFQPNYCSPLLSFSHTQTFTTSDQIFISLELAKTLWLLNFKWLKYRFNSNHLKSFYLLMYVQLNIWGLMCLLSAFFFLLSNRFRLIIFVSNESLSIVDMKERQSLVEMCHFSPLPFRFHSFSRSLSLSSFLYFLAIFSLPIFDIHRCKNSMIYLNQKLLP